MGPDAGEAFAVLGITPCEYPDVRLTVALCRARAVGVLDLGRDPALAEAALQEVARHAPGPFGVRVPPGAPLPDPARLPAGADWVVLPAGADPAPYAPRRVLVQVVSLEEARAAVAAGACGLIAVGNESGGRVGEESAFVLLQRLVAADLGVPLYVQGGIGLHTAAACLVGGAAGVVLDSQLALVRESGLPESVRALVRAMDGSETTVIAGHRVYTRPDLELPRRLVGADVATVRDHLGHDDPARRLLPLGQDAAFAARFAARFATAGGVVQAIRRSVEEHLEHAVAHRPLAAGAPLAREHGTRYPVLQGPMTRVSDRAGFAAAVAEGGGLPFLALSLMRGEQVLRLLEETGEALGDRPWGAGILGFVPAELRAEQLEAIERVRPPFAIIAGGRPSQARALEKLGIKTYLHVPSPGLLELFLEEGARRFVFEGRECGGHVGPRTSFVLWESQVERLLRHPAVGETAVVFAGGVHDARSAAMVAALAGSLAARGARIGVLMGTAYLFTEEAVATGAIEPTYQEMALRCRETALLETAPGHATRCVETDYVRLFRTERERMEAGGAEPREVWISLEQLNLGRLRIAAKGLERVGDRLVRVPAEKQRREGMYMIGQVAALRDRTTTIADLHHEVGEGATGLLTAVRAAAASESRPEPCDIAVIGMACVFPGAPDLDTFWANVVAGVNSITEVPAERWNPEIYYDPDGEPGMTTPSKWGGFVDDVLLDPAAYGIPPRSLAAIEPVQLIALEVARRALEDAGYADREFDRERTSVVIGAEAGTDLSGAYGFRALFPQYVGELPEELDRVLPLPTEDTFPGILANVVAGRIANRLDLGGVNYTVDAACASSLAAVHAGVQLLRGGGSDMVLAGGADFHNSINDYLMFSSVRALSPSGQCRAFDHAADGITLGEGAGVVVLKRLEDALRDGDRIHAVIKGIAGSSDGKSLGLTAPRKEGQMRALRRAYRQAGVSPTEVGLVEAHGTGTVVGDRTELDSMSEVFAREHVRSCALGSVKSNIGHTKCAAGMASLIKTVLSVKHGVVPPTLLIERPNPYYDPERSPFAFYDRVRPWVDRRRIAGASAFGFGGTNFHVVVSRHEDDVLLDDEPERGLRRWPAETFLIHAEDDQEARAMLDALERQCQGRPLRRLRDLAASCSLAGEGPVRIAIVARDHQDLLRKIAAARAGEKGAEGVFLRDPRTPRGKVAFLMPGQGSQRVGMMGELFATFPELADLARAGARWLDRIFPEQAFDAEQRRAQEAALTDTRVAQPALGLCDLAMARLLEEFGVRPDLLGGHSYGELAALCVAGALEPSDLLDLSEARARAILAAAGDDPGTMAAVAAPAEEVAALLNGTNQVVVANVNAPRQTIVSGPVAAVEEACRRFAEAGLAARPIPVACAFHSPVVAGAARIFAAELERVNLRAPRVPVWSNRTATPYPAEAAAVREGLARQLGEAVRFVEQVESMYEAGARIFVEAGPGRVLTGLVGKILGDRPHVAVATDAPGESGLVQLQLALARLAVHDVAVDAAALYRGRGCERFDLLAAPAPSLPPLAWFVNGQCARPATGEAPEGAMIPVTEPPARLSLGGAPASEREASVLEYLRNVRELAEAQRQVMLGFLGAPPEPAAVPVRAQVVASTQEPAEPGDAVAQMEAGTARKSTADLLLEIVSERTGYPIEMLDLDLDLEADLSIDSIKRIEILGALNERTGLAERLGDAEGQDELVEELAALKTLRAILQWLEEHEDLAGAGAGTEPEPAAPEAPAEATTTSAAGQIGRYVLEVERTAAADRNGVVLSGLRFALAGDGGGVAAVLREQLEELGAAVGFVSEAAELERVDGLVHLGALDPRSGPEEVKRLFELVQRALAGGVRWIVGVTGLGGRHGRAANGHVKPGQGGIAGLLKSLAKEHPDLRVRAIDVDPTEPPEQIARYVRDEILAGDDHVEVGYCEGNRHLVRVVAAELPEGGARPEGPATLFDSDSVVLVTGGARGITARVAIDLARRFGCRLELVGRSPLPEEEEDAVTRDLEDPVALKRRLFELAPDASIVEVERRARALLAAREIRATLAAIRAAGAEVSYHAVDVRDDEAFGAVIDSIYERYGRLDGVLHGAGVIEDKLASHKTPESFARVFDTKVRGALTLVRHLREDVRLVVFFSSVSSAFGNRGQTDYAAANDVLDKLALHLNERLPSARVLSVNWGPWDSAGMVSPELRREYARRGVGLIDPDRGVASLLDEILRGDRRDAQVILMNAEPGALA